MFLRMNRITVAFALNILTGILLACWAQLPASAQAVMPANTSVSYTAPGAAPPQGLAPPQGSGPIPAPVTSGDQGTSPLVPNASPQPTVPEHGTNFQYEAMPPHSRVNLLVDAGDGRGTRVALTFDPGTLSASQQSQIEGALNLGAGALSGNQPYQNIDSSVEEIENIQNILNPPVPPSGTVGPYSGTPAPGDTIRGKGMAPRSFIAADQPGQGYPRYESNGIEPKNQEIREFSRYLVIKGVVVACIMLAFAAAGVIFGAQHAGGKVIAAAGGLMLLLMAYSIWKVDMYNALTARGQPQGGAEAPDSYDITNPPLSPMEQVQGSPTYDGDMTLAQDKREGSTSSTFPEANLPVTPSPQQGANRPGLSLAPLGAAH